MSQLYLGKPAVHGNEAAFRDWVLRAFAEIERQSFNDVHVIAKDFSVTGHTATRTLNAGTATLANVANVLCTFIEDLQKRGMKRTQ